jgi:hypothetical protein
MAVCAATALASSICAFVWVKRDAAEAADR